MEWMVSTGWTSLQSPFGAFDGLGTESYSLSAWASYHAAKQCHDDLCKTLDKFLIRVERLRKRIKEVNNE